MSSKRAGRISVVVLGSVLMTLLMLSAAYVSANNIIGATTSMPGMPTSSSSMGSISTGSLSSTSTETAPPQGPWVNATAKAVSSRLPPGRSVIGTPSLNVVFAATMVNATPGATYTYHWYFGDKIFANATSATILHTYNTTGTYQASVYATDNKGNSYPGGFFSITVLAKMIPVTITATPPSGPAPLAVNITVTVQGNTGAFSYTIFVIDIQTGQRVYNYSTSIGEGGGSKSIMTEPFPVGQYLAYVSGLDGGANSVGGAAGPAPFTVFPNMTPPPMP